MRPGLVSISFRKLSAEQVAAAAATAGLECVEWGGDIHVPHGDIARAAEVAKLTSDHGLSVSAYGSYLRLGEPSSPSYSAILDSASALGAPTIRVWAGAKGSATSSADDRRAVVKAALEFAELAAARKMTICYEFHGNTLTDTGESAARLLAETQHPAILSLWQPTIGLSIPECLDSLDCVLPRLLNVHAFHWWPTAKHHLPLAEGRNRWAAYLHAIRDAGKDPDVLLEFLPGNDPAALAGEAVTLRELLAEQAG